MSSRSRISVFTFLIYAAFFASGAASLTAEVTWNRMLIVVVGNSLSATAMIIVVFMGGLGLGSYLGGKAFSGRRPSLVPYLLIEAAVGAYVLLSPVLFSGLSGVFSGLAEGIDARAGLTAVRILVTLAALLIPATLMGASFPAMVSGTASVEGPAERRSARTGYLYSVNTLGAALGCFAAGYYMLLELGVRITLTCAFGLYMFAAAAALAASALVRGQLAASARVPAGSATVPDRTEQAIAPAVPSAPGRARFLAGATFAIGFVALAYEVLLTRLSILYLGNAVSIFPLVLTGFLLGTGISAVLGTRLYDAWCRDERTTFRFFGIAAFGAGAAVMAIPYLLLTDLVIGTGRFARFTDAAPQNPWPILLLIIAPTILIGALLPLAIRMLHPSGRREATRGPATLYALNTAGGLLGAAVANHFLVPLIGMQKTLACLTAICGAVGLFALLEGGIAAEAARGNRPRPLGRGRIAGALAAVLAVGVLLSAALPDMTHLYAKKIAASTRARATDIRLVREGRAATVTVIDQKDPALGTYRDMYLNGVEEASTRYWHTQLFKLLGILPILVHPSEAPKQVLVIAFGAGITAGSTLASDQVASTDVVDLNPDIEGINDLFTDVNGDVYHQPRFHFHNDDGRNYLVTSSKKYDVIISDSTHPRAYDSWILYTEEFYRSVQRRLAPGGVFAQWVPVLGSMQGDLFRIHLNTFRKVFPNATFWYVYGSDQAFLLATPEPFALDAARLAPKLERLPEWFRAGEYQIDTPARIAGFFWMDPAALGRMIGRETRVNTDDVHYFDKQITLVPAPPQGRLPFHQASALSVLRNASDELKTSALEEQATARLLAMYGFFQSKDDLYRAWCASPENGNARYFMEREFADSLPEPRRFCIEQSVKEYRTLLAQHPNDPRALNALADVLAEWGELAEAQALAEKAVGLAPGNGMILDTYGWILYKQARFDAALESLRRSSALLPDHPIVLYHLGAAEIAAGNAARGRQLISRALEVKGDFPGADEARKLIRR